MQTISGSSTGLNTPDGLSQDSNGDLIVANVFGETVTEYPNAPPFGNEPAHFTITGGTSQLDFPEQLDVDAANNVYVANQFGGVNEYHPGSVAPASIISGGSTGLAAPMRSRWRRR